MAKVFLDTNIVIDLVEKRGIIDSEDLDGQQLFISPLSLHILLYVTKHKIPYSKLSLMMSNFSLVPFNEVVAKLSLEGPTKDFEDNVQLHSGAEAECDLFLTSDQSLLGLHFFGKMRIIDKLKSS